MKVNKIVFSAKAKKGELYEETNFDINRITGPFYLWL